MDALPAKTWMILGGAAVAGVALGSLVGGTLADEGGVSPDGFGGYTPVDVGGNWVDPNAPARIAYYADQISAITGWGPTLKRFLIAVAYWESRGNSQACHGACEIGSARGWFQIRQGAKCLDNSGFTPNTMLFNEPAQVAIAACHIVQLGKPPWANTGQAVQTRDIRRGWKFPSWVASQYRNDPDTFFNRDSYIETLQVVGDTSSFAYAPMFPPGFSWPGLNAALEAVGA